MVERMARATREECLEAVLRVIPAVVEVNHEQLYAWDLSRPDGREAARNHRRRTQGRPPEDGRHHLLGRWMGQLEHPRAAP